MTERLTQVACLTSAIVVVLGGCQTFRATSSGCSSAKELRLDIVELHRLRRFVARMQEDEAEDSKYNHLSGYCFKPLLVNSKQAGLIAIVRRGHSHEGPVYFINGRRRITPLKIEPVSPQRFGPAEYSTGEKQQMNKALEEALARHADELDDSLQYRI